MLSQVLQNNRIKLLIGGAAALLVLGVLLWIFLMPPRQAAAPAETTAPTTEATTAPTEAPTLPPPDPNPYGAADFGYDGQFLTCLAGVSLTGIDISDHQPEDIDWAMVKEAGVEFVIIRVGYRGYGTGALVADEHARRYYEDAKEAGLLVGAYFFSQAISPEEALEEAEFALSAMEGWELELPLAYDWEYISESARTGAVDGRTLTDCTLAFCEAVEAAGYRAMVYFNQNQALNMLRLEELTDYASWLAMYTDSMTWPYRFDFWQYGYSGSVPGIEGPVDLNLYFPEQQKS